METAEKEVELKKQDVWRGMYRNIPFEIKHTQKSKYELESPYRMPEQWTAYIFASARKMSEESKKRFILDVVESETSPGRYWHTHNYMTIPIDCHWGLTYYALHGAKTANLDGRCAEMGWDYMHLDDEQHHYTENWILMDVKEAIDSLLAMAPEMETAK